MQTENKPTAFQLQEAISDAKQRLEKVEALINCLSNEYLDWPGKIDVKTVVEFVRNGTSDENSEAGKRACDWANGYAHIQKVFEIIEDYVHEAKNILQAVDEGGKANA